MKNNILMILLCLLGMATENTYAQTVFKHTAMTTNTQANYTHINHKSANNKKEAVIFVTHTYNNKSTFVKSPLGVWNNNGKWAVFRQDRKALKKGTTLNVLVMSERDEKVFRHTATSRNTSGHITTLNHPATNGNPNAKLIISQYWGKKVYNNHSIGVYYSGGKWKIYNQDFSAMPENAMFNILVDYKNTYQHKVTKQNVAGHTTVLNNKKIGTTGSKCLFITQAWEGIYNPHPVGIWKAGKKWTIYNEDGKTMPENARFNVLSLPIRSVIVTNPDDRDIATSVLKAKGVKLPFLKKVQDIEYEIINGMAVFQGDIVIGTAKEIIAPPPPPIVQPMSLIQLRRKYGQGGDVGSIDQGLGVLKDPDRKWGRGLIPYEISLAFNDREVASILNNINILDRATNLAFVPRTRERDYIYFDKENLGELVAGNSRLGRRGGKQDINLNSNGNWVGSQVVIHEILHALGVYHEQSRSDRDNYVIINKEDVPLRLRHNFRKCDYDETELCGPYDVRSIMHYSGCAFVNCSEGDAPSIVDRRTGEPISATRRLSATDIDCLNFLYPTDAGSGLTRDLTTIDNINLIINEITTRDLEGGLTGKNPDFYVETEIGAGLNWRPREAGNSTQTHRTATIDERSSIRPDWEINAAIPAGESFAKVIIRLHDEDGTVIERYDEYDINPMHGAGYNFLSLGVNLVNHEIWLLDDRGGEVELIGYLGREITIEGYSGDSRATISFNLRKNSRR